VDPYNIQVICDWTTPTPLTEIQSFLGILNFYRQFMLGFSDISWALDRVTKGCGKKTSEWEKAHQ
jgi:hypothetical protein